MGDGGFFEMMSLPVLERDAVSVLQVIQRGGVALVQTQTGYGLVAMRSEGVKRIYELKGRPSEKPCVTVGTMEILDQVTTGIDPATRAWLAVATAAWPLAVIASLRRESHLLASFEPFVAAQCTKVDTIATFFGVGALISKVASLAQSQGQLVVGSSANLAGTGNNYRLEDVPRSMRSGVDLELDYGPARFTSGDKLASTILDLTKETFQRKGVHFDEIAQSWKAFSTGQGRSKQALSTTQTPTLLAS
jgi:tRNA A37 threonylcarbamoyladenosine synthetase subunit TsaC/SUA5/YrdC